ncbi:MAG: hypothetical protein GF329_22050 [Candidatus Lokiarchaeota archaeon]|nr:hypothetical protein [Candidatus Lokiarchaeota archaeon]
MSEDEVRTKVSLKLVKDMIFQCEMGNIEMSVKECYIDETNQEEADMWGPNPTRLLASAITGCLSASFLFCLKKKDFPLDDFEAESEAIIARNEQGRLRVKEINVKLNPKSDNEDVLKRINQCEKFFEKFCTVTASVREGVNVNVKVDI